MFVLFVSSHFGKFLGVWLLSSYGSLCLYFIKSAKCFPKWQYHFEFPPLANDVIFLFLNIFVWFWYKGSTSFIKWVGNNIFLFATWKIWVRCVLLLLSFFWWNLPLKSSEPGDITVSLWRFFIKDLIESTFSISYDIHIY